MQVETEIDDEVEWWLLQNWECNFDWDEHNLRKLDKHDLTVFEVVSMFDGTILFGGRILPPPNIKWAERRYIIFGKSNTKKRLALIWTIRGSALRPITCRRMRDNEKRQYDKIAN